MNVLICGCTLSCFLCAYRLRLIFTPLLILVAFQEGAGTMHGRPGCYPNVPCAFVVCLSLSPAAMPWFRREISGELTRARHQFPCFLLGMNVPHAKAWRCVKKDQIGSYPYMVSWGCMLCGAGTKVRLKDYKNAFFYYLLNKTLITEISPPPPASLSSYV